MFDFLNSGEEAPQQGIGGVLNPGMDPVTQAFMLNAGLRLLSGGWGGPATRVAGALSSGMEAAGGAAAIEEQQRRTNVKEGQTQQELDQRLQMHREDIGSREKIAKMYADQRIETAKLRGGGVDRTTTEWHKNRRAYELNHQYDTKYTNNPEQLLQDAIDAADQVDTAAAARAGKTSPNPGSAAPPVGPAGAQQTPGKTSPNLAPAAAAAPPREPPYKVFEREKAAEAAKLRPSTLGGTANPRGVSFPAAKSTLTPVSEVLKSKNLDPELRRILLHNSQNAAGRKFLESKYGIDGLK